jgi:hypothetical protein
VSSSGDLQSTDDGSGHDTAVFPVDLDDEGETPSGAAEAEMWAEELPNDSALLVVKRGRNAGARFLLNQPITIAGRLPGSDIFLDDVTVSRRHAEFRTEDGRHRVVDIGSLNKTYVNRRPVESAILANGDEIQIGRFRLVFLKHCPPGVNPMAPSRRQVWVSACNRAVRRARLIVAGDPHIADPDLTGTATDLWVGANDSVMA